MKCDYCKKDIVTSRSTFPYHDRHKDLYWHVDCHLLITSIADMDPQILRQLQKQVANILKQNVKNTLKNKKDG